MSLVNTIGSIARDPKAGRPDGDQMSAGAYAELLALAPPGAAYVSAALNVSSEVLDSTGGTSGGLVAGRSYRVTPTIATGLLTFQDAGDYLIEAVLEEHIQAAAAGNISIEVRYAPDGLVASLAAFSTVETAGGAGAMIATQPATAAAKNLGVRRIQRVAGLSAIQVRITASGNSGTTTINSGYIRVTKIADTDPPSMS